MQRGSWVVVALLAAVAGAEPAPERFVFPADRGGRLLEEILTPASKSARPAAEAAQPRPRPEPAALARPELALPPVALTVSRLATQPVSSSLRPRPLPDEIPLSSQRADLIPPRRPELAVAAGVRLPAIDIDRPVPLPFLAKPAPDREPLTDPTSALSTQAALAAEPPVRNGPAPFIRENLPDPFENRSAVRLPSIPAEDGTPVAPTAPR